MMTSLLVMAIYLIACTGPNTEEFDIPEGEASETFLEFARQAGVEIIFDPEIVRGVRTRSISGSMPPTQAIQLMIEGTGLYIQADTQTKAIAIRKTQD